LRLFLTLILLALSCIVFFVFFKDFLNLEQQLMILIAFVSFLIGRLASSD
jgi:hypothetical protein